MCWMDDTHSYPHDLLSTPTIAVKGLSQGWSCKKRKIEENVCIHRSGLVVTSGLVCRLRDTDKIGPVHLPPPLSHQST